MPEKKSDNKQKADIPQPANVVGTIHIYGDVIGSNIVIGNDNTLSLGIVLDTNPLPEFDEHTSIPSTGDLPIGSYLPFPRNPLFTGREADLKFIAESLLSRNTNTIINQAIAGMGGLGKTQLAVEFAYCLGKFFHGVHWLNMANPESINGEIAHCGLQMGLPNFPDDLPSQVTLTLNTWKAHGPRLLILDNFEAVELVNEVMKHFNHSNLRVLITSRRSDWPTTSGLHLIPLELFSQAESLAFLKESMKKRNNKDDELNTLAEKLGYLPLALELAGRYLNDHHRLNVTAYLEQAKEAIEHPSMKDWRVDLPASTGHDLDLQRSFALSWLALKDEIAQKIFQMAGYLAPNTEIPLNVFEKGLNISPEACDENISILFGLGLLHKSENNLPTIHPLLAEYARSLSKENSRILESLADAFKILSAQAIDTGLPFHFIPLRTHMPVLATYAENEKLESTSVLLNNYGHHLSNIADYWGASAAFERAIKFLEANIGVVPIYIATVINNLGEVMRIQGNFSRARVLLERAINIWETNLGAENLQVAFCVSNLGTLMKDMGDLPGARAAYERALKIFEVNLGVNDSNVATLVNNLGLVTRDMNDLPGARVLLARALKIFEANLGIDHPKVAILINNLGLVIKDMGDLSEARVLFERAINVLEINLGTEHPHVAAGLNNLGLVMTGMDDFQGARTVYERALKIDETKFGPDHPDVARDINNLGNILRVLGDLPSARAAYERGLTISKKFFPPDHPNIKTAQRNLDSLDE